MITLQNDSILIKVSPLGAELTSLYHSSYQQEYMWQAEAIWPKHSPVLFPIVGQLKDNHYRYNDHQYTLSRHGFAREKAFTLIEQSDTQLTFRLSDDEKTLEVFPFHFHFDVIYSIHNNCLQVTYVVTNTGTGTLLFSVGAHPAFQLPLDPNIQYSDYSLSFEKEEVSGRWLLENGLIGNTAIPFFQGKELPLTKALFDNDALVFKKIVSDYVDLKSAKHSRGLRFHLNQCPYLGIWAARGADFICIEPWHGIADSVNSTGELHEKEGILTLAPGQEHRSGWAVEVY